MILNTTGRCFNQEKTPPLIRQEHPVMLWFPNITTQLPTTIINEDNSLYHLRDDKINQTISSNIVYSHLLNDLDSDQKNMILSPLSLGHIHPEENMKEFTNTFHEDILSAFDIPKELKFERIINQLNQHRWPRRCQLRYQHLHYKNNNKVQSQLVHITRKSLKKTRNKQSVNVYSCTRKNLLQFHQKSKSIPSLLNTPNIPPIQSVNDPLYVLDQQDYYLQLYDKNKLKMVNESILSKMFYLLVDEQQNPDTENLDLIKDQTIMSNHTHNPMIKKLYDQPYVLLNCHALYTDNEHIDDLSKQCQESLSFNLFPIIQSMYCCVCGKQDNFLMHCDYCPLSFHITCLMTHPSFATFITTRQDVLYWDTHTVHHESNVQDATSSASLKTSFPQYVKIYDPLQKKQFFDHSINDGIDDKLQHHLINHTSDTTLFQSVHNLQNASTVDRTLIHHCLYLTQETIPLETFYFTSYNVYNRTTCDLPHTLMKHHRLLNSRIGFRISNGIYFEHLSKIKWFNLCQLNHQTIIKAHHLYNTSTDHHDPRKIVSVSDSFMNSKRPQSLHISECVHTPNQFTHPDVIPAGITSCKYSKIKLSNHYELKQHTQQMPSNIDVHKKTFGSNKHRIWKCPKCYFIYFEQMNAYHISNKRYYFNLLLWKYYIYRLMGSSFSRLCTPFEFNVSDIFIEIHYSERSLLRTQSFNRQITQSHDFLHHLKDIPNYMILLLKDCCQRIMQALETLIFQETNIKQNDKLNSLLKNGGSIAWLLAILIQFLRFDFGWEIRDKCHLLGLYVLNQWNHLLENEPFDFEINSSLPLCILKGAEAYRLLSPDSQYYTTSLKIVNQYFHNCQFSNRFQYDTAHRHQRRHKCPNCDHPYHPNSHSIMFHNIVCLLYVWIGVSGLCSDCNFYLMTPFHSVPYQTNTTAAIWASLLLRNRLNDQDTLLKNVLLERQWLYPWRTLQELGVKQYQSQLSFIIILIFIISEWGHYDLNPEDLIEEYLTLKASLRILISLDDLERLGQVLQCLYLFGITYNVSRDSEDSWLQTSLEMSLAYLLYKELCYEKKSCVTSCNKSVYSQIYTYYCALMGLMTIQHMTLPKKKKMSHPTQQLLIQLFHSNHTQTPHLLPGENLRPTISIDASSRLELTPVIQSHMRLIDIPCFWIKNETKMLLSRPNRIQRDSLKRENQETNDYVLLKERMPICFQHINTANHCHKDYIKIRLGVVGVEWAVLALDLAIVLRLEKSLFARLISRIYISPPIVLLRHVWPPDPIKQKYIQHPLSLDIQTEQTPLYHTDTKQETNYFLTSKFPSASMNKQETTTDDSVSHSIFSNLFHQNQNQYNLQHSVNRPCMTSEVLECSLGQSLLIVIPDGPTYAIALSQSLLIQLIDVVERQLFEETYFVCLPVLKEFVNTVFKNNTSSVEWDTTHSCNSTHLSDKNKVQDAENTSPVTLIEKLEKESGEFGSDTIMHGTMLLDDTIQMNLSYNIKEGIQKEPFNYNHYKPNQETKDTTICYDKTFVLPERTNKSFKKGRQTLKKQECIIKLKNKKTKLKISTSNLKDNYLSNPNSLLTTNFNNTRLLNKTNKKKIYTNTNISNTCNMPNDSLQILLDKMEDTCNNYYQLYF